ncbi:MAG: DUF3256 family protein [Dysgonamonadaceae bacterium]|jgi:hypothetical protein|nr:DUF3256 family protein [Dysgonamonadaceae bacterium]
MHIKHKIINTIACLFVFYTVQTQEISVYFLSMPPGEWMLPLDAGRKKELVNAYREASPAQTKNLFNDTILLQQMTDNYLSIHSGASRTEMALLTMSNYSKLICVIHTICAPVCDSRISFYSTDWKRLDTDDFFVPEKISYFLTETPDDQGTAAAQSLLSEISLMQYHINPEDLSLVQTYNTPQYLDKETARQIEPYLKKTSRIFYWMKNHYKP